MTKQNTSKLTGPRLVIDKHSDVYPELLFELPKPPEKLYVIGDPAAFRCGLAVVGARKATPYGISCAKRFSSLAAARGISIISGGARGCDSAAHQAAVDCRAPSVAVLGGGCDCIYPKQNFWLFQEIIDNGGVVVSEWEWDTQPLPAFFRYRNRIIAGLAKATLVVEAGLPSGTFVTADETLDIGRDVLVVPGSICAPNSLGTNRLLYQGAMPVVDDESFLDCISSLFDENEICLARTKNHTFVEAKELHESVAQKQTLAEDPLICAILAQPLSQDEMYSLAKQECKSADPAPWISIRVEEALRQGLIARYPDGKYGAFA